MSDVDYIALAFEPHGNVTMRQLRRAALREREAKAALAARLAEVEAERDGVSMQNDLAGEQLREMAAERDRLAQELEGALGHLRDVAKRARSLRDVEAERDEARRRLAEVEAERDEAVKLAYERIEKQNVETGKRVDLIHEREAFRADRDRLAQEHDELLAEFHEYAEHQSWRCGHAPHYYLVGGEALESCPCGLDEVLARFPREGDGDDS